MKTVNMIIYLALFLSGTSHSQNTCDSNLEAIDNDEISYKQRGNRCEGFYKSDVSSNSIDLIGVIKGQLVYELKESEMIEISASPLINQSLHLRAQAIPLKTYYRMDALLSAGEVFHWPVKDVLLPRNLNYRQISIYGLFSDGTNDIYVPLRVKSDSNSIVNDNVLRVILRPTINLDNVHYNYYEFATNKSTEWKKKFKGSYIAGQPLIIDLRDAPVGKIRLTVAATIQGLEDDWLEIQVIILNQ